MKKISKLLIVSIGFVLTGLAISLYLSAGFGSDTITVLTSGISNTLGISVGMAALAFYFVVIVGAFIVDRHYIGAATFLSLVIVGPSIDFFMWLFSPIVSPESPAFVRLFFFLFAFFCLSFSIALYLSATIGISAADIIPIIVSEKAHIEFRWCKIAFDVVVVTIGMILGGVFAWGTIVAVIGTGPMIQYIRKHIEGRLNQWFDKFDKKILNEGDSTMNTLFSEYTLKGLTLKNRIVMAPMCMYSATEDGFPTQWHKTHYVTRAIGGVGLIIVEATAVSPEGRLTSNDLGLWDDSHIQGLREIVDSVHSHGAKIGIQLNHGGRKCEAVGMEIEAPSPIPFNEGGIIPKEMDQSDIETTVGEFQAAAVRAEKAGFDLILIHAAHGYLLSEFLSPITNHREDKYGGSPENRVRLLGEVLNAVRAVWPKEKPINVRISAEDYGEGGNLAEDLAEMLNLIKHKGIDMVDVSTGGVIPVAPKAFAGYQIPHAETIKKLTGLPVTAGGVIFDPGYANQIIEEGKADFIFLGRELLRNPYWPLMAAKDLDVDIEWPQQYLRAKR